VTSIDDEIQKALDASVSMIRAYVMWYDKIQIGEMRNTVYSDVTDFVNFRVESADSCLQLIGHTKIADALGLSRAILENYMLLMLMCRGRKYFRIQNLESKSQAEFDRYLRDQQANLEGLRHTGEAQALYVDKYPRTKRRLMYVFEGLTSVDEPDFFIPAHFFQFQDFHPETHRLKDSEYFQYRLPGQQEQRMRKDRKSEAENLYRFYLSYDALRVCLELNDLLPGGATARLEAHYTLLGKFLHPTHNAARQLHESSNFFSGQTAVGMDQRYTKASILLAALYVAYLLAGILDEVAGFLEAAPKKYVRDAGTGDLRSLTESVPRNFPYFWFLFNPPPLWDKFTYAVHHIDDQELKKFGGYENIPDSVVTFDSDIYQHLRSAITAWINGRVGAYRSPLPDMNAAPRANIGFPPPKSV
jgi:hypothetical protein